MVEPVQPEVGECLQDEVGVVLGVDGEREPLVVSRIGLCGELTVRRVLGAIEGVRPQDRHPHEQGAIFVGTPGGTEVRVDYRRVGKHPLAQAP